MVWIQLAIAVVLFVVGELLRKPPPDAEPANFEDFGFPDIDSGKRVPIFWGRKRLQSLHTIDVQGYLTRAIQVKSGLFGGKTDVGFKYYASMDVGVCRGPSVTLKKIIIDDKLVWEGTADAATAGVAIDINDRDFFGKKDGIRGTIRWYGGSASQEQNAIMKAYHDTDGLPTPAYRHLAHAVFEDFYFGNSPTVGQIEFVCERYPNTLGIGADRKVNTTPNTSPTEGAVDLAIPEIIHEILTNDDWGLGESSVNDIDTVFFTDAAITLRNETIPNAMSLVWKSGDSVEDLLKTVMQQADGFVFKRMSTGLWEMNLARDDYLALSSPLNNETILEFDETNSHLVRYNRGNWDETFNIVNVSWQDRNLKGKPAPAGAQDMANFAIQGDRQVANFTFPGCHSPELANFLASRQMRATSFPLAICEITTNRLAFDLSPGDMVSFAWDKLGITQIFMRISKISMGEPEQNEIRLSLVQDVFGSAHAVFAPPGASLATEQAGAPVQISTQFITDQTPWISSQDPDNALKNEKPMFLAEAPQGNALQYRPYAKLSAGATYIEQDVDYGFALTGTLDADENPENGDTGITIVVNGVTGAVDIETSPALLTDDVQRDLGSGIIVVEDSGSPSGASPAWNVEEIISYAQATVSGGVITLTGCNRAVEDTVPRRLKAGDRVWFMAGNTGFTVDVYTDSDVVNVKLQNEASTGAVNVDDATAGTVNMRRRLDRPIVPGGLKSRSSNSSPITGRRYWGNKQMPPGNITFTYNRRDKDNTSLYFQADADDAPALNYVVDIDIYEESGGTVTFLRTLTGSGSSLSYTKVQQTADGLFTKYVAVMRAHDDSESPRLASLTQVRHHFIYDPVISPEPSPVVAAATSPFASPTSPGPSPWSPRPFPSPKISPITSPKSPGPSPWSPLPSPQSPVPSPHSPAGVNLSPITSPQDYTSFLQSVIAPDHLWLMDAKTLNSPQAIADVGSASPKIPLPDFRGDVTVGTRKLTASTVKATYYDPTVTASPRPSVREDNLTALQEISDTGGTIGALIRPQNNGQNSTLLSYGSKTVNEALWLVITPTSPTSIGNIAIVVVDGFGVDELDVRLRVDLDTSKTHFIIVRQPVTGLGVDFFVNGTWYKGTDSPNFIENVDVIGAISVDSWFSRIAADEAMVIGDYSADTGPSHSHVSHAFVDSVIWTDKTAIDLWNRFNKIVSPATSPLSDVSPQTAPPPLSPISPQAAISGYRGVILADDPAAYWPMSEDRVAEGSPGIISPITDVAVFEEITGIVTVTEGSAAVGNYPLTRDNYHHSIGSAAESGGYVQANDAAALDFADTWGIDFWFISGRNTGSTTNRGRLFARSATAHEIEVSIMDDAASPNAGHLYFGVANGATEAYSTIRVDDGVPHHFAARQDVSGGNATIILYLDGNPFAQTAAIAKPAASANPLFFLGGPALVGPRAAISQVAIYDTLLLETEILTHFMEGVRWEPFFSTTLRAAPTGWWRRANPVNANVLDWIGSVHGNVEANAIEPTTFTGGPLIGQRGEYFQLFSSAVSPTASIDLGDEPYVSVDQTIGGFAGWLRRPASPNVGNSWLWALGGDSSSTYFALLVGNDGYPRLIVRQNTSSNQVEFNPIQQSTPSPHTWSVADDAEWWHLAVIKRAPGEMPKWYINGIEYESDGNASGTGAVTDWVNDVAASSVNSPQELNWNIGARGFTTGVKDAFSEIGVAEPMYWSATSVLPTAAQMLEMYASSKANFPTLADRMAEEMPDTLFVLDDKDAALGDDFNNTADGTYTGTLIDQQMPMAADDRTETVLFDPSAASSYVDFADHLLKSLSDLTSPLGNIPKHHSLIVTGMHEQINSRSDNTQHMMMVANTNAALNGLNMYLEVTTGFDVQAFPESAKGLRTKENVWRAGHAAIMAYVQAAKTRGAINSPADGSSRRIYFNAEEAAYDPLASPDIGDNDTDYIEKYSNGVNTQMRIGAWEGATGANNRAWGGIIGHVVAFDRALSLYEHTKIGRRQQGWQEFPLEVMAHNPVLYLRLNDPADAREALDFSGNGYNGDVIGTPIFDATTQQSNLWHEDAGVMDGNGSGSVQVVAAEKLAGIAADWSVGFWAFVPASPVLSNAASLVFTDSSGAPGSIEITIESNTSPQQEYRLAVRINTGPQVTSAGANNLTPGQWHFCTITYDALGRDFTGYVGAEQVLNGIIGSPASASPQNFDTLTVNGITQEGVYHDVFVVNDKVLTQAQIRHMYARSFAPTYDRLVVAYTATAYWKLEEIGDRNEYLDAVKDSTGHYLVSVPATAHSPEAQPNALPLLDAYPMPSVLLNGSGIDTGWLEYPTSTNPLSIVFWARPQGAWTSGVFLSMGDPGGAGGSRLTVQTDITTSPHVIRVGIGGSTQKDWAIPQDGLRHHYAFVWSGGALSGLDLYIDGVVQVGAGTGVSTRSLTLTNNLHIGVFANGTTSPLDATRISRVSIHAELLDLDQIRAMYLAGSGTQVTSP